VPDVHIFAIDRAKRSFQVCATDPGGSCVDTPVLQGDFGRCNGVALQSIVCQASDRGLNTTGRYAVRRTRATSVQRAWLARAPGLVYPIPNIEVLAAYFVGRSPREGFAALRRFP
jgi:hypothetical protein